MVYKPKNFRLEELVPPGIFKARGERAWEMLDARALFTLQTLRDKFGPFIVNNWHVGGLFKESGLRSLETKTGAKLSQHRFGRAIDAKHGTLSASEILRYIQEHREDFPYLTTVENPAMTPGWFHFDVRNHFQPGIWIVNP